MREKYIWQRQPAKVRAKLLLYRLSEVYNLIFTKL